ncbi:MAG: InlB B-repeat-containing protein, partial [Clostridia bacterium]|nr:InlB B-repeat-containing protein [Clostridia bacterium]
MKNVFLKRAFSLVMALTLVITFACVLQAAPQTARAASMDVMIVIGESARPFFDKTSIDMSWNTAQTVEDLLENLYRWQMNANKSEFETSDIIVKNGNTVIPHSRKLGDIAGGSGVTLTIEIPNAACLFVYNYEGFSESGDVGSRYYPPNSVLDEVPALMPETYDGHAFLGWYTDEACQTSPQFPLTLSQNVTFYAKWEHTPGEPVQENITDATCTQDGSYD